MSSPNAAWPYQVRLKDMQTSEAVLRPEYRAI